MAFEAELGIDEAGGEGAENGGDAEEVEEGDQIAPQVGKKVITELTQVEEVEREEAEEDQALSPLSGIAEKRSEVFEEEGAEVVG